MGLFSSLGKVALAPLTGGASLLKGTSLSDPLGGVTNMLMGPETKNKFDADAAVGQVAPITNPNAGMAEGVGQQFLGAMANPREAPQGQAAGIDMARMDQGLGLGMDSRAQQQQLAGQLQAAAAGAVPSAAQMQMQQGLEQGLRGQLAAANSAHGGAGASLAAMRGAQDQGARMVTDVNNQGAQLRAQEMATARGQLGGVLGGMRGADQARAGLGLDAASQQAGLDQQMALGNMDMQMQGRQVDDARVLGLGGMTMDFGQQEIDRQRGQEGLLLDRDLGVAGIDAGVAAGNLDAGFKRRGAVLGAITGGAQMAMKGGA